MRLIKALLFITVLGTGSWWLWNYSEKVLEVIGSYVENGEFLTLEARYTAEQIMEQHRSDLIVDASHSFLEPSLKFYPYLLMEVNYTDDLKKSHEGVLLWSLVDGEMVINTRNWETTHGFQDFIKSGATRADFKIMNALAKNGSSLTRPQLEMILNVDTETLEPWLSSALRKHLIIQKDNEIYLQFQNPKLPLAPQTKINQWLVTKPYNHAQRLKKQFSKGQIERSARAAFGDDFSVRNAKEVFLPVYIIEVLNPDQSILTSYWNALTGQRLTQSHQTLGMELGY